MRALIAVAFILAIVPSAFASYGVDVSQPTSVSSFQCMKNDGLDFAIVRTFQSNGVNDPNGVHTVANAWAGGMSYVDVYMFPCPTCSASAASQVTSAVNYLKSYNTRFGQFWFDIEGTQYWTGSQSENQAFFNELKSTGASLGLNMGVYTSASQWDPIMGSGFTGGSNLPLWYAHVRQFFSSFPPFLMVDSHNTFLALLCLVRTISTIVCFSVLFFVFFPLFLFDSN